MTSKMVRPVPTIFRQVLAIALSTLLLGGWENQSRVTCGAAANER